MPGEIVPTILRRVLNNLSVYEKVGEFRKVDKISISAPVTNTSAVRIAAVKNPADTEYDELQPGDSILWEVTLQGQALTFLVYALPGTANDVLIVTTWR